MRLYAVLGAGAAYELGKDLGFWGKAATVIPPPGVLGQDGHPIMTGDPAVDMRSMLNWTGYRMIDQPLYKAFQASVPGLTTDGYPGPHTMAALTTVLAQKGLTPPNVPTYPWLGPPHGYDGVNAPTAAQWGRGAPAKNAANPATPPAGTAGGSTDMNVQPTGQNVQTAGNAPGPAPTITGALGAAGAGVAGAAQQSIVDDIEGLGTNIANAL